MKPVNKRLILIFLAGCLIAMLCASLWHRFTDPSLTVKRFAEAGVPVNPAMDNSMDAIGKLMEAAAKNPRDVPVLLRLAETLMAAGQWESAENFVQKALTEPGDHTRPMYLLAVIHHNRGQHAEAAELLTQLLEKKENASARYSLAILYIHYLNNPEAGREQLEKGLAAADGNPGLHQAMQEELGKLPPVVEKAPVAPRENGNG